jgi:hydrogenase/urease accessory protein HupE
MAAILPAAAQAHVAVETIELLAGALHPWINLDSALILVGLSLWLTQSATATEIRPFVVLGLALAAGVASGLVLRVNAPLWLISLMALAVGLCVGLQLKPILAIRTSSAGSLAAAAGYYAGIDAAPDVMSPLAFTAGALAGAFVLPLALMIVVGERRSRALQTGIRIIGSWLAAIGLMLFALRLQGRLLL